MNGPVNQHVIIKGLTGLGKSTLAHFIARQLQYNGIKANRIHEAEDPHLVTIDVEPDIAIFMDVSLKKWQAFIAQVQGSGARFANCGHG